MQSAPQSETTAPTTHSRRVGKDAVNAAAIVLGTMKMDDAMIVPTLIIVASRRPSSGRRPSSPAAAVTWLMGCPKLAPAPAGRYPDPSAHSIATIMGDPAPMRRTAPLLLALFAVPALASAQAAPAPAAPAQPAQPDTADHLRPGLFRSEEHTSELQSRFGTSY